MTSLTDSSLIIIICLFFFLILSLITNGVFFSISLYRNVRPKPKAKIAKEDHLETNRESSYVQMSDLQENETISPYYTKMATTIAPPVPILAPKEPASSMPVVQRSKYVNLSDVNKS
ncbi:hypothetical protein LOD99_5121 [Oopsacas minuta]|uniref:Uncharacterized protein n=1 Tax=Oopsacas minuta TaxID=111878 RepID=A0AAV7JRK3_9METZ|nr:hypothetical protein LOD99_5121 [Oopsacas minuta]